jgi:hypothetical protein
VDRKRVTILRVLDEKDDEKGKHGRRGVDDELPRIGVIKKWTGHRPDQNQKGHQQKSFVVAARARDRIGDRGESLRYRRGLMTDRVQTRSLIGWGFQ